MARMAAGAQAAGEVAAPTGAEILAAITSCKETLTAKIDFLTVDVSLKCQDMDKFQFRIAEVEDRVSTVEDTVRSDSREVKALQLQVKALQECAIDTENRLRRNNIRILGLPERAEDPRPAEFTEQLSQTHLTGSKVLALKNPWVQRALHATYSSYSRGVSILISKRIPCVVHEVHLDPQGKFVMVVLSVYNKKYVIVNVYLPPPEPGAHSVHII